MKLQQVNYQIAVTYRCNLHCPDCYQMFDRLPCLDETSDVSVEDVKVAARILDMFSIRCGKLRFTGGEPMLHPKIKELFEAAKTEWAPAGWFRTYTSGAAGAEHVHLSKRPPRAKASMHLPVLISPMDLGLTPKLGWTTPCKQQGVCGRLFDVYGFGPCPMSASLDKLFGKDSHRWAPVLFCDPDHCKHCIHSLGMAERVRLGRMAKAGELEYPTKTYADALRKRKRRGYVKAKTFREKLPDHLQHLYDEVDDGT